MKIFFTASYTGKKEYQKYYDVIVDTIRKANVELISLEVQKHEDLLDKKLIKKLKREEIHYMYTKKGIDQAHAVIIETSREGFQLGHEATLALLYNKPVLCLSKNWRFSNSIKHRNFFAYKYKSASELPNIINKFIKDTKRKYLSVRFNLFLSPNQKNFITWFSRRVNRNESEIIRSLIDEKISQEKDFEKDKYISL